MLYDFAEKSCEDLCIDGNIHNEYTTNKVIDPDGNIVGHFKFHKLYDLIIKQKSHFCSRILSFIWKPPITFVRVQIKYSGLIPKFIPLIPKLGEVLNKE